jgi:succinyl-CoA synthetase alpha subunit
MGHAGAIISGSSGKAGDKIDALRAAGVAVTANPAEIGATLQEAMMAGAKTKKHVAVKPSAKPAKGGKKGK